MFMIDYHAYECINPSLTMIVSMSYVQTVNSKAKPVDLSKEGEKFLRSLHFTSATSRAPSEKFLQNRLGSIGSRSRRLLNQSQ